MLLHLVFYAILIGAVVLPFLGSLTIVHAVGKLTTKSEAPKRVDAPGEAEARRAKVLKMMAEAAKSRQEYLAAHQN